MRHHLLFSLTAFKRDVHDPKTVSDFVAVVRSLERLRLLLVLTKADICAVGPKVWNGWKGALLHELYAHAAERISGGHRAPGMPARVAAAKAALGKRLAGWSEAAVARHVERLYPPYWVAVDGETHVRHAEMIAEAERSNQTFALDMWPNDFEAVARVEFFSADQWGLFADVAGAFALAGANIVGAQIFTTRDDMALDRFSVQDSQGAAFDCRHGKDRLSGLIANVLNNEIDIGQALSEQRNWPPGTEVFRVEPRVLIDNNASTRHTVIEVNGRDRPGLLYEVTRVLHRLDLTIVSAHVSTFGESAVDVFYVKDPIGQKISSEPKLETIRVTLRNILALTDDSLPSATAVAG